MAHLDNLGLSKKINKKFQDQDLDKASEKIGVSHVKRISWILFVGEIVEFCESNGIEISKATDEHGLPGKLEIYLTDSLKRIDYTIVSQEYSTDRGYRVSGDKFKKFVKLSINEIAAINEIEGFFYPEIAYYKYKDNALVDFDRYHGPALVNAPRLVPEDMYKYKNGNKILLPKYHYYEITSLAAKDICHLLKDLSTLSKICVEKYKRTNLTFSSFKRLLEKNISKEFIPSCHSIENGQFYYDYKFWDTIVEGKNCNNNGIDLDSKLNTRLERVKEYLLTESDLGLNKKIQKKYDDKSVEDTIEEINILDKEGFEEALVKKFSESPIVEGFEGSLAEYNTTRITLKNQWRIEDNHVWIIIQNSKFMLHFVIECNGLTTVYFPIGNAESLIDYVEKDKVKPDYEWRKRLFSECWLDFTYKNIQDALQFVESYANGNVGSSWYDESAIYRALSESKVSLGLNKKVQDKHKSKDSIVNVAEKLDPETFKNLAEENLCGIQGVKQMLRAGNISDGDIAYFGLDCDSDLYFFSKVPSKEGMHGVPFLKIYNYHDTEKSKFAFYFSTKHKEGNDEIETLHQFGIENKVDRYSPYPDVKFDLTYDNLTMLVTWLKGEIMSISKINESQTNLGISSKVKKKFVEKDPVSNICETLPPEKFIEAYFDRVRKDIQEHVSDTCKFAYHHQLMKLVSSQNFAVNLDISGGYFYIGIQKYDYQDNEWLINRVAYNSDKFISCAFEEKNADKTDVVYLPNRFSEGHSIKYKLTTTMIDSIVKWMIKDSGCEAIANIPLTEKYLNLGLSNKVRKRFDDKDPIADITTLDKEDFFALCGREFSKSEFVRETRKGLYNEKQDWDFYYVFVDKSLKFTSDVIYIRVGDNGTRFRAYASFNGATMAYKIGAFHKYVQVLDDSDLSNNEISSIIENNVYFALTYENILKVREFFEKIFKGEIDDEWYDKESIREYELRSKVVNENNLGLNKKVQKKFNDTDAVENVSIMDEAAFKEFAIEYINSHTKFKFLHEITKKLEFTELYKVSVLRFWNFEVKKGLSLFVNKDTFAVIEVDGEYWDNYTDCFNFSEKTLPAATKLFSTFDERNPNKRIQLSPYNLANEVRDSADKDMLLNENNLGLNKKIQKKFNNNDPISEITVLDKDDFFTFCDRVFSESEFVTDTKKGIYNETRDWDFLYVHFMTPNRYSSTIYIRVEDGGSNFCAYGMIEGAEVYFPIGKMQPIRETLLTETDLSDGEIFDIINEKIHFGLTYKNIIEAREFFEKLIKDGNPENFVFTDTIDDLLKHTKTINENKLGLNKKIQKKFNDVDSVENVSIMDEASFKEFAIEYINSHTKYKFLHEISKGLRYDELYKVSVMRFWNYEFRKGLSVFVNDSTFAIISIDGKWDNYSDCFNFGERTIPAADEMFNVFCKLENKDSHTLTPKNLKEEVRICADETLMINESDLGLNKKIQKKFNDNVEDKAEEISELTFMEFWNEAKDRFERISEELDGGDVRFYPSVEDPELRKLCRDENWISVSFKNVGRFVIVAKSKYQNYPKYKNLLEDSFRLYLSYILNPSERFYEHHEIDFHGGSGHIVNPDKSSEWYFKMNYYNLDKAIEWMREQITDNSNEDRLVQMV